MTRDQQKALRERLTRIIQAKPTRYSPLSLPEPAHVRKAREAIERAGEITTQFDKREQEAKELRARRIEQMRSACEKAIYFGTPQAALDLLDKFESTEF